MALYDRKQVDFSFADARGTLTQLVHGGYQQVNVLFTKQGVLRGGHYHKVCGEAFFVISGSVEVTLKKPGEAETETVLFRQNDFFAIRPGVVHSMSFPEDCLMVQMYDVPVESDDGTKDIIPEAI